MKFTFSQHPSTGFVGMTFNVQKNKRQARKMQKRKNDTTPKTEIGFELYMLKDTTPYRDTRAVVNCVLCRDYIVMLPVHFVC